MEQFQHYYDLGNNGGAGRINGPWGGSVANYNIWTLGTSTSTTTPNGTRKAISRDGLVILSNNNNDNGTGNNQNFFIGGGYNTGVGTSNPFDGKLAELIVYTGVPSELDQEKIQSYLAVKYGITKNSADNAGTAPQDERDYFASDGSVTWDYSANSAYPNRVAGIGRDGELNQPQSRSVQAGSVVTVLTPSNLDDIEYLILGDDNAAMDAGGVADYPSGEGVIGRIARIWKLGATGNVGTVSIRFDLSSVPGSKTAADLRLLIDRDKDGVFADETVAGGGIVAGANDLGGSVFEFTLVGFNDGEHISVGTASITTPLPITLISFDAVSHNGFIKVTWSTATEINNDYFTLQKSYEGFEFKEVARIPGKGNSLKLNKYEFLDNETLLGDLIYYRLKQTDYDGKSSLSKVISVKAPDRAEFDFSITPNPADRQVTIQILGNDELRNITLYNAQGQAVNEVSISDSGNSFLLDIENLRAGLYLVYVSNGKTTAIKKLIKK